MPYPKKFSSYSASLLSTVNEQNQQVQDRLALYQVFLRIYEQNRDLLNGILELEHSGNRLLPSTTSVYVQGVTLANTVYLVTNLMEGKTQVISHPDTYWTIGRDSHYATLPIADRRLSRRHAAISYNQEQQTFELRDLNSTNGSFINEEQIVKPQPLHDGDRVRLGGASFTFFTYALPLETGAIALPDSEIVSPSNSAVEEQKHTAGLESSPERRKLLSGDCSEDTMMVLKPLQSREF
ncbi:MAG: FHA domain-containing protein [Cyanothece sp. SIO2G6]|nr:FHA domain-containing protein [Cyanothece sp. SIO2G6]